MTCKYCLKYQLLYEYNLFWAQVKTSTNQNVYNKNVYKPKRLQTETSTNQNVYKPNVYKPKRLQTKRLQAKMGQFDR